MKYLDFPKMPKLDLPLPRVLQGILGLVILLELMLLYQTVFLGFRHREPMVDIALSPVRIDVQEFNEAQIWIETNSEYVLERYSLTSPDSGRENPFLEYR